MQGSLKRDTFSAGLNIKGFGALKDRSELSIHSKFEEKRNKLTSIILMYNCFENLLLFLMMLNSVIYPSATSALYFVFTLTLTMISMTRNQKTV